MAERKRRNERGSGGREARELICKVAFHIVADSYDDDDDGGDGGGSGDDVVERTRRLSKKPSSRPVDESTGDRIPNYVRPRDIRRRDNPTNVALSCRSSSLVVSRFKDFGLMGALCSSIRRHGICMGLAHTVRVMYAQNKQGGGLLSRLISRTGLTGLMGWRTGSSPYGNDKGAFISRRAVAAVLNR